MSAEPAGQLCGALCCLGMWGSLAAGGAWLAHRRMTRIEGELQAAATPGREKALLWYAGASTVWVVAAGLAIVGLSRRDRVRVGRDCLWILLGHFTVVVVGAVGGSFLGGPGSPGGPVVMAACIVGVSAVAAFSFAWRWSGLRGARLAAADATDEGPYRTAASKPPEAPGAWRFGLYAASLCMWPAGLVSAATFTRPHDAHVGMWALRCSLGQLLAIALAVCLGLGIFAATQ